MALALDESAVARRSNSQIFTYFGALVFLIALASPVGYLGDISTTYMLKNRLHATASEVANFRIYTAIPVYLAFVFGFIRDRWNPLGLRDRGYLLIFGPVTAVAYAWLAWRELSVAGLMAGMLVATLAFRLVGAAYQGLISLIGREKLMSGRLVSVWQIVASIPSVTAAFASGWAARALDPMHTFSLLAALSLVIGLVGLWKPSVVYAHAYEEPEARRGDLVGDLKRLLGHRAIYPAILVNFMWNFAPGAATPLQYYLSNELHASDAVYANYNAIFAASFIPTFFLYGLLCKRVVLRKLLIWGTVVAVPQMIPLALVRSPESAMWLAAPIGLMGGVATAAYFDLAIRSCPPGLQGTLMMGVDAVLVVSGRFGDRLGSAIYDADPARGFLHCVIATTVVYALILPVVVFLVPSSIVATADGELGPPSEVEAPAEVPRSPS
ncbi:MAG TPA: MFS transporter [Polyangiaceae bacterium]|nr:MFS transporter [Polyangiaceae bacterium]